MKRYSSAELGLGAPGYELPSVWVKRLWPWPGIERQSRSLIAGGCPAAAGLPREQTKSVSRPGNRPLLIVKGVRRTGRRPGKIAKGVRRTGRRPGKIAKGVCRTGRRPGKIAKGVCRTGRGLGKISTRARPCRGTREVDHNTDGCYRRLISVSPPGLAPTHPAPWEPKSPSS